MYGMDQFTLFMGIMIGLRLLDAICPYAFVAGIILLTLRFTIFRNKDSIARIVLSVLGILSLLVASVYTIILILFHMYVSFH